METYDCAYFDTLKQNDALEWFLPIHLPGHWILAYIDFRNKVGEVFDSWNNTPRPVVIAHLKLLIEHIFATHAGRDHKEYHANTLKNDAEWTFFDRNVTEPLTPQQQDGYNCGIFVLWFIYCKLSKGLNVRPMTVTPQVLRKEFAKALVNRQLTFLPF
jgi:Ulp1 family protease